MGRIANRVSAVRTRLSGLFSPRVFAVVLAIGTAGALFGGFLPVIGSFGGLIGIAAVAGMYGLLGRRVYLEVGLAGGLATAVAALIDHLVIAVAAGVGNTVLLMGSALGVAAGVVGHYIGRDLRNGLTREI